MRPMQTKKLLHIFRPGQQTDMSGRVIDFTEADLSACAAAYDPALHEAPIVVGHPKTDSPAYGWVSGLASARDGLFAEPVQVDPQFSEMVGAGRFKKISASFYLPDSPSNPKPGVYYLRHVGFLGAQPPAVKGLKPVEFGETEQGVVEFGDYDDQLNASLWRRLREWFIGASGIETADQVVPGWAVASLEQMANEETDDEGAPEPSYSEQQESTVTPAEKAALEAENARLKAELDASNAEKAAQAAQRAAEAKQRRHGENAAFAEGLVAEGRLKPAHRDAVVAFMDFACADESAQFGEGDGAKPLATALREFLAEQPKVVEFSEFATGGRAGSAPDRNDPMAIAADAVAYQEAEAAKGHTINSAEAVAAVLAGKHKK